MIAESESNTSQPTSAALLKSFPERARNVPVAASYRIKNPQKKIATTATTVAAASALANIAPFYSSWPVEGEGKAVKIALDSARQ
jgi:hypothetical protein